MFYILSVNTFPVFLVKLLSRQLKTECQIYLATAQDLVALAPNEHFEIVYLSRERSCLSVCMSVCLCLCLSVCISVSLPSLCLSPCLFTELFWPCLAFELILQNPGLSLTKAKIVHISVIEYSRWCGGELYSPVYWIRGDVVTGADELHVKSSLQLLSNLAGRYLLPMRLRRSFFSVLG